MTKIERLIRQVLNTAPAATGETAKALHELSFYHLPTPREQAKAILKNLREAKIDLALSPEEVILNVIETPLKE